MIKGGPRRPALVDITVIYTQMPERIRLKTVASETCWAATAPISKALFSPWVQKSVPDVIYPHSCHRVMDGSVSASRRPPKGSYSLPICLHWPTWVANCNRALAALAILHNTSHGLFWWHKSNCYHPRSYYLFARCRRIYHIHPMFALYTITARNIYRTEVYGEPNIATTLQS